MATGGELDIESMVAKPTWKQILMDLILTERIDPWNIDICTISDRFLAKVREMKKLDLLIPANVILAAAILLRYKSGFLRLYDPQPMQETLPVEESYAMEEMPQLVISSRIPPKRQISLEELTQEIESVIKYENNVYVPKHKGGIEETVNFTLTQEDIEKKMDDVSSVMKMVLMFAIPLTVGALAIPDSYVTLLRTENAGSGPVLMVLAVDSFVMVISGFYSSVLYGMENVDEGSRLSLRHLAKSRLFIAFSLPYLHSAITLPTAFYILTNYAQNQPFQAALYVSAINAIARFTMFIILYVVVRGMVRVHIPWRSISKYVLAAAVMGTVLFLIPHPTSKFTTLIETAAGGLIYLGLLMAIDKEARRLPRDIIGEFRHKQAAPES